MNVVLLGMKHCGKSTLGRALAGRRGWRFFDTDDLMVSLHQEATGEQLTAREILRRDGPEGFAEWEHRAVAHLRELLEALPGPAVIALGGRTAVREDLEPVLGELGLKLFLEVDPAELLRRILAGGVPPFLDADDPEGSFRALYEQRLGRYLALADEVVPLTGLGKREALDAVDKAVQRRMEDA